MTNDMTDRRMIDVLRRMRSDIDIIRRQITSATQRVPARLSPEGQQISDWDNATSSGFFWGDGAASSPASGVIVGSVTSNGSTIVQHAAKDDGTREYVRFSTDGGATWSTWKIAMGRHITDNASNGRAYVGTGSTATNEGGTYIGMSPVSATDTANAFWFQTADRQVLAILKDGHVISPMLPFATASGTATTNSSGTVTVTFPSGKFTTAPNITLGSLTVGGLIYCSAKSATSATFAGRTTTGAALAMGFNWVATQMSQGSASG